MRFMLAVWLISGAMLIFGCGSQSDGVSELEWPQWDVSLELVIGGADDPHGTALHQVRDIAVDGADTIYALDGAEVRIFSPDGSPRGELGGRGQAPGEFMTPVVLGWRADTLWVGDVAAARLTLIVDREAVETISYVSAVSGAELQGPLRPMELLHDGTVRGIPTVPSRLIADGSVDSLSSVRTTREGALLNRIASHSVAQTVMELRDIAGPGSSTLTSQPFVVGDLASVDARGRGLVRVGSRSDERGCLDGSMSVRIERFTVEGEPEIGVDLDLPSAPLNPQDVDERVDELTTSLQYAVPGREVAWGASEARIREVLHVPTCMPPVSNLVAGMDGSVWLSISRNPEHRADLVSWISVDLQGGVEGAVELPSTFSMMEANGDSLWGTVETDLGVIQIARYGVSR